LRGDSAAHISDGIWQAVELSMRKALYYEFNPDQQKKYRD